MAAAALEARFETDPRVDVVRRIDVRESVNDVYRAFYDDAYFKLVESVPWLVGWGYDVNDPPFKLGNAASRWDRINTTAAVRAIKKFRPDTVVCTHFLPTRLVTLMITRGVLDCTLSAVTTDYDFQGLWLSSPFNRFFVARSETEAFMTDIGVPADRLTVSGIPVRPEIGTQTDQSELRARFGLSPELPVLLISAGAAGGEYTKSIIQQTLRMVSPFQAVVVCGRNAELKREVKRLVKHRRDQYQVLGYTTEMADLMRAATVFVGKPGGLSSSEAMAAGLPMVLINPIPGQEDRNSDYLLEEGAAVRCNYETTVGHKIDGLLSTPGRIEQMAANARRIGKPDAAATIVSTVLAEERAPLWISRTAQQSILDATKAGITTADLGTPARTRTLYDAATGASRAVMTNDQLGWLGHLRENRYPGDQRLTVSAADLANLHRQGRHADTDLLLVLRRILGARDSLALDVV